MDAAASAYADESTILLVKQKVWSPGPIYLDDAPWKKLESGDLSGIQRFLVDILISPIVVEAGDLPCALLSKDYLSRMGVRSLSKAVDRYKYASIRLRNGSLVAIPSVRDVRSKSWRPKATEICEAMWKQGSLGATVLLEALRMSE